MGGGRAATFKSCGCKGAAGNAQAAQASWRRPGRPCKPPLDIRTPRLVPAARAQAEIRSQAELTMLLAALGVAELQAAVARLCV